MHETALSFACAGERLIGVVSHPAGVPAQTGVVIVVGGPQYRAGSHRQFALLARALAAAGYAALRFDCRGMGDSSGDAPGFDAIDADIAAAITTLQTACPDVEKVVLWGLCDGASAALLYGARTSDSRLGGFALANPWMHTAQAQAHAIVHTRYRQRLREGAFWRKLLSGGINPFSKLSEVIGHWRTAGVGGSSGEAQDEMRMALSDLRLPVLMLLCARDATAQEFLAQLELSGSSLLMQTHVRRADFADADHTFSRAEWRCDVETETIGWLNEISSKT